MQNQACGSAVLRLLAVFWPALALGLRCSCATPARAQTKPWIEDNQKIGTITSTKAPWGYSYYYKDLSGRLVRSERRDASHQLCGGACITLFDHDPAGRLNTAQHLDASEKPCLTAQGYAVCRWAYFPQADGCQAVEESYFDCAGKAVCAEAG
jgi:hypothetical protein